jgi:hypothetical protein
LTVQSTRWGLPSEAAGMSQLSGYVGHLVFFEVQGGTCDQAVCDGRRGSFQRGMKNDETDVQTQVVSIFYFREAKQLERWPYPEDSVARE